MNRVELGRCPSLDLQCGSDTSRAGVPLLGDDDEPLDLRGTGQAPVYLGDCPGYPLLEPGIVHQFGDVGRRQSLISGPRPNLVVVQRDDGADLGPAVTDHEHRTGQMRS